MSNQRTQSKFLLFVSVQKTKIDETYDLLLEISPNKEHSIMTDQEDFQQQPMRTNCKQLQKIGQYSLKCHNHSPISITNFSHSDQYLVPVLSCHFLPVRRSNINNFHQLEIIFLDDTQTKGLNHFLTLEMSSRRHKKTSQINHFLRENL